jgi:DNA polymerase I-like protein with 3'-5' exonuclease and polymerase domains
MMHGVFTFRFDLITYRQAKHYLHVRTLTGRLRHVPDINNTNDSGKRATAERQAVNSIIQGTASDIIKYAMIRIEDEIASFSKIDNQATTEVSDSERIASINSEDKVLFLSSRLLMQIHDELIFEVPNHAAFLHRFVRFITDIMEREVISKFHLHVPLATNVSVGEVWGEMSDYQHPTPS